MALFLSKAGLKRVSKKRTSRIGSERTTNERVLRAWNSFNFFSSHFEAFSLYFNELSAFIKDTLTKKKKTSHTVLNTDSHLGH